MPCRQENTNAKHIDERADLMKTPNRCLLPSGLLSQWINWPGWAPQTRLICVAILSALALGGVSKTPESGPDLLERVGSWPGFTRGPALSVGLADHHAYVAIGEGGLAVLDVVDPAKPVRVGGYHPPGRTDLVRIAGRRVYLATSVHAGGGCEQEGWRGNLVILDVSDPTSPKLLGSYQTGDSITSFCVDGDRVFLQDGHQFHIVDIANPARPVALHVGSPRDAGAGSVLWAGHQQVYAGADNWIVMDVSQPGSPTLVSNVPYVEGGAEVRGIQVVSNRVYAVEGAFRDQNTPSRGRLSIYEAEAGAVPHLLGKLDLANVALNARVAGNYAYVATAQDGVAIIDVSNPSLPVRVGTWDTAGVAVQVEIEGDHAFVADYHGGLQVFDIRNPSQLAQVASFDTGLTSREVLVSGGKACVLSSNTHPSAYPSESRSRLEIVDISNPTQPALLASREAPWNDLIDMLPGLGFDRSGAGQHVADGYAYSGVGWEGFDVNDVHNPTNAVKVGGYDTRGEVHDLWVTNHYAYVAEGWEGLEVFDVSQPAQPFPIGRVHTRAQARGVQVSGNYVYVAEGGGGLAIFSLAPGPVTIIDDPGSLGAATGEAATLIVRAYGRGTLSYQWYLGESGDVSRPIAGANSTTYTTPALTEASAYWVRVSGAGGVSDSRTAWIHLVPPVSVELLSLWPGYPRGPATDVQVDGNLAYIAAGNAGLVIYDFSDPAAPRRLGGYDTKEWASGIALSGNLVFLACGAEGVHIVDVSNPAAPVRVGRFESSRYANSIAVVGSYAYVAGNGLVVIDVSNPATPRRIGEGDEPGGGSWFTGVAVIGNYAYLVGRLYNTGWNRTVLAVIDVSNPAAPHRVGVYETTGSVGGVSVLGNYAYLAVGVSLEIIDVGNPTNPRRVAGYAAGLHALTITVRGEYAYVADGVGLHVLDVKDPKNPQQVGSYKATWGGTSGIALSGDYVYVAAVAGLQMIDIATPVNPKLAGFVETGGSVEDLSVSGRYAYLAGDGLEILDVSDPTQPILAARSREFAVYVAINGKRLYVQGGGDGFQVFDIANPTQPTLLGNREGVLGSGVHPYVAPAGDYVYFGGEDLEIADVRNPAEPTYVGRFYHVGAGGGGGMSIGNYAFWARKWVGLQILDLSVPTEPRHVGAYYPEAPVSDVAVRGSFAFLTEGSDLSGLEVIDIGDPQCPVRAAKVSLPVANNIQMMGSYACVTGDGLQVFDIGDPYHPVRVGHHQLGAATTRLQVVGNLVYVVAGEYGLAIYRLTPQLMLNPPGFDGNELRLSWLGAPGIRLQRATGLSDRDWQDVPNSEGVSSLQLSQTNRAAFFRLAKP